MRRRRLMQRAGLLALMVVAGGGSLTAANADQEQCVRDAPYVTSLCVGTTNQGGNDGDVHRAWVSGHQSVPGLALGFSVAVECDDDGGAGPATVTVNAGPEAPVTVPGACPDLP